MNVNNSKIIGFAKAALSGLLLFLLLRSISWEGLVHSWSNANLGWCIFTLIVSIGVIFVSAWRWQLLLASVGIEPPSLNRLVYYYFVSYFFNNFAPANIAGDAARVNALYQQGKDGAAATATVVLERLLNLAGLGVICSWVLLARPLPIALHFDLLYLEIIGLSLFIGLILCIWIFRNPPAFFRSLILQMRALWNNMKKHPRQLGQAIAITMLLHLITMLIVFGALQAVLVPLPLFIHLAVYAIAGLVLTLPISIQGIGVREGIYIGLFSLVGVGSDRVVAALGISYVILVFFSVLGGLFFWLGSRQTRTQAS